MQGLLSENRLHDSETLGVFWQAGERVVFAFRFYMLPLLLYLTLGIFLTIRQPTQRVWEGEPCLLSLYLYVDKNPPGSCITNMAPHVPSHSSFSYRLAVGIITSIGLSVMRELSFEPGIRKPDWEKGELSP